SGPVSRTRQARPRGSAGADVRAERNVVESLLPLLLIFAVMMLPLMYMSSRQKKAQRQQQERNAALGSGDEVRTHSGSCGLIGDEVRSDTDLYGVIVDEVDDLVIAEPQSGAQTKWARQAIHQKVEDPEIAHLDEADEDEAACADGAIPGVIVDDDRDDDRRVR